MKLYRSDETEKSRFVTFEEALTRSEPGESFKLTGSVKEKVAIKVKLVVEVV